MFPRRTNMPNIKSLAYSEDRKIAAVIENINFSYLAQKHSSVTRLKQLITSVRCKVLLIYSFPARPRAEI